MRGKKNFVPTTGSGDPYYDLAVGVVIRAGYDYETAYIRYREGKDRKAALEEMQKIERFFRGYMGCFQLDVDGEYMLDVLKERIKQRYDGERILAATANTGGKG